MKQHSGRYNPKSIVIYLIIIFAVLAVYWKTGNFDFINFDDGEYVYDNPRVPEGLSWDSIQWAFGFSKEALVFYWHPLTWISLMLDTHFFGINPGIHHLINVVFHAINSILLFIIFKQMTGSLWKSVFLALLFAVHPINVESVAWISERKNVLSTFFWLLTMLTYTHYALKPSLKKRIPMLIFFILGLLSKPMLVTLPFVFLLLDVWPLRRLQWFDAGNSDPREHLPEFRKATFGQLILEKLPLFILSFSSIGISVFSVHSTSQILPENMISFPLRISNAIVIYIKYIINLVWPHDMAVFYPFPQHIPAWQIVGAATLLIAITLSVIVFLKKAPYFSVGWFWYLGTLFPIIGIFQSGKWPEMADRWAYVPAIGLYLIVAWGASAVFDKYRIPRNIRIFGATAIIIILAVCTGRQVEHWKNSKTLFQHTVEVTENNSVAHFNLGAALSKEENFTQALTHYTQALLLEPSNSKIYSNMGTALARTGKIDEAIIAFKKAILLSPDYADAYLNLANALAQTEDVDAAILNYQKALALASPTKIKNWVDQRLVFHNTIGIALVKTSQLDKAIDHFKQAILLSPDDKDTRFNLANALVRNMEMDAAIEQYKKILSIDPNHIDAQSRLKKLSAYQDEFETAKKRIEDQLAPNPDNPVLHYQLGRFYENRGLPDKALESFRTAVDFNPVFWEALYRQALIHAGKKEYDKSISLFKQVVSLQPENAAIYYNIACLYSIQNQKTDAVDWLQKAIDSGYRNWERIKNDPDLENLRQTSFYKQLINEPAGRAPKR